MAIEKNASFEAENHQRMPANLISKSEASELYLEKQASAEYLKKSDAAATYAPKTGTPTHWQINGPTVQDLVRIYSSSSGFTKIYDSKNVFGNGAKWYCGWFYSYNAYGNTSDGTFLFLKLFLLNVANPEELNYLVTGKYPGPWTIKKI